MAAEVMSKNSKISSTSVAFSSNSSKMPAISISKPTTNVVETSSVADFSSSKPNLNVGPKVNVKDPSPTLHNQQNQNFHQISPFPNMPRLWKRVEINLENCLLNEEKLNNPPSLSDGMSADLERELRYLACELIQSASILLKLPQVAAATGQVLFQRFYYSKSFVRYNFEQTAMACINLASKIEETPRRIRDVINVFHHMKQLNRIRESKSATLLTKKPIPMVIDQKYVTVKNEVIKAERRVLKELGFCVHVKHPHKLIISYLQALDSLKPKVIEKSWNFMNDGLRSDIFLRYTPETVACACICLASRKLNHPLPSVQLSKEDFGAISKRNPDFKPKAEPYEWWELFTPPDTNILDVCNQIWKLYNRKRKPNWEKLEDQVNRLRQALLEKQAATKSTGGIENTPNPHSATVVASTEKFSPPSRPGSPKYSVNKKRDYYYKDEKANGSLDEYNKKFQGYPRQQLKRYRRRSRSKSPADSDYPPHQEYHKGSSSGYMGPSKRRYLPPPPPPGAPSQHSAPQQRRPYKDEHPPQDDHFGHRSSKHRSESRSPSLGHRHRKRKRSRSSSRLRREQEKREREVREALGKPVEKPAENFRRGDKEFLPRRR